MIFVKYELLFFVFVPIKLLQTTFSNVSSPENEANGMGIFEIGDKLLTCHPQRSGMGIFEYMINPFDSIIGRILWRNRSMLDFYFQLTEPCKGGFSF